MSDFSTSPCCPVDGSNDTRTIGACSGSRYLYRCNFCGARWYQTCPLAMRSTETLANVVFYKSSNRREYTCRKCGAAKKNHVCPYAKGRGISKPAKNRCGKCGELKRGHVCSAIASRQNILALVDDEDVDLSDLTESIALSDSRPQSTTPFWCESCGEWAEDDALVKSCVVCVEACVHVLCMDDLTREFVCASCKTATMCASRSSHSEAS